MSPLALMRKNIRLFFLLPAVLLVPACIAFASPPKSREAKSTQPPSDPKQESTLEILTPTGGVDFSGYTARTRQSIRRNWYAVMPQSAMYGEKGKVVIRFKILKDGALPPQKLEVESSSGNDPLDRAALAAIKNTAPFEHLPEAFKGPYIALRIIFLYNLPLASAGK
ncbi:MAG: TonB family protein [Candidatus Acidiferrales bacterium]